jgi:hypothetical protein
MISVLSILGGIKLTIVHLKYYASSRKYYVRECAGYSPVLCSVIGDSRAYVRRELKYPDKEESLGGSDCQGAGLVSRNQAGLSVA